jgi:hypothetical protein
MDFALHVVGGLLAALYAVRCGVAKRGLVEVFVLIVAFGFVRESWQHAATPAWKWSAHIVNEAGAWGVGAAVVLAHRLAEVRRARRRRGQWAAAAGWWQRESQILRAAWGKR